MNKQEAIDSLKKDRYTVPFDAVELNYNAALDKAIGTVRKIDEPEKPVIPQFVADWIEVCKAHLTTSLYTAMNPNFMKENDQSSGFILWIKKTSNQETLARAWLDGYEVEQERRYRIKMKNEKYNHTVVIGDCTRKELDDAGFGWVFDCEDVEVQEVE